MTERRTPILVILLFCLLLSAAAGCAQRPGTIPAPTGTPSGDYLNIDPERRPMPQKITLFYLHKTLRAVGARDPDRVQGRHLDGTVCHV